MLIRYTTVHFIYTLMNDWLPLDNVFLSQRWALLRMSSPLTCNTTNVTVMHETVKGHSNIGAFSKDVGLLLQTT